MNTRSCSPVRFALGLRARAVLYGILLTGLIALGSHGFHWFDAALILRDSRRYV